MIQNMSFIDRTLRICLAVVIAYLYFTGTIAGTIAIVLLVVAVIFAATSLINYCPLYPLLGIRRWEKNGKSKGG